MPSADTSGNDIIAHGNTVYQTPVLFQVIREHMPPNRRRGYYPAYYYNKPSLLCNSEMNTLDAPLYHQRYLHAIDQQHQGRARKCRFCAVQWCAMCVTMRCIRPSLR